MPELPEVETVVRGLRPLLIGRTITGAIFPAPPGRMMTISANDLAAKIAGQHVERIERRAKYILVRLSANTLAIHLKMTGRLYVLPVGEASENDRYLRVTFLLDNGREFRFSDPRRFGRVLFGPSPDAILPALGPEPLDDSFTLDAFRERIKGRSGTLKPLLLNQGFVAGIGNIYADEALHIAKLHPLRRADSLTEDEIARLHEAIRQSLSDGVRYEGASVQWYRKADGSKGESQEHFRVYHDPRSEKNKRCPVCGSPIAVIRVGQRGTHFCPVCQPTPLS
jgi:formamidopyrimidine-DNA glycosylase